jgi:predicted transcriptional regulator
MNIQYVRLEHDVCERVNEAARELGRTVSDLVNQVLREHLAGEAARADEVARVERKAAE